MKTFGLCSSLFRINATQANKHGINSALRFSTTSTIRGPEKRRYIPRRAVLYVPGSDERKLKKIPSLGADCIVMDCEDGVALSKKFPGATRTNEAKELSFARQYVVTVAKAFKLQAIDLVYIDYKDLAGLKVQSEEGAGMGFTGKQVIHPGQVPVVQAAFSPPPEKIEWAKALIQAFEEHQKEGKGAFTFRGNMIDMPLLLQARNIVQLASSL
ncbi:citramalyl-CoA lyase, mitochondrial-like [Penaeus chinensis]|uniref:citramalyl-CoA lyase, mitochondrial-like n=1 Tax=Penaeus chinensis TaxID=139456 RepID=UPI001FB73387|nr:citramalyl-CoA lyase, mitochondrial-like [Penaeus chinensis]